MVIKTNRVPSVNGSSIQPVQLVLDVAHLTREHRNIFRIDSFEMFQVHDAFHEEVKFLIQYRVRKRRRFLDPKIVLVEAICIDPKDPETKVFGRVYLESPRGRVRREYVFGGFHPPGHGVIALFRVKILGKSIAKDEPDLGYAANRIVKGAQFPFDTAVQRRG